MLQLLLLDSVDIGRVHLVPGGHVLLHACGGARLLAAGQSLSGLGNALFEANLLEILRLHVSTCSPFSGRPAATMLTSIRTRALATLASV